MLEELELENDKIKSLEGFPSLKRVKSCYSNLGFIKDCPELMELDVKYTPFIIASNVPKLKWFISTGTNLISIPESVIDLGLYNSHLTKFENTNYRVLKIHEPTKNVIVANDLRIEALEIENGICSISNLPNVKLLTLTNVCIEKLENLPKVEQLVIRNVSLYSSIRELSKMNLSKLELHINYPIAPILPTIESLKCLKFNAPRIQFEEQPNVIILNNCNDKAKTIDLDKFPRLEEFVGTNGGVKFLITDRKLKICGCKIMKSASFKYSTETKDGYQCPICYDVISNGGDLDCQHSFCVDCLINCKLEVCPICRQ
ncbi:hypothetical protein GEMRC1_005124 [Eukaryota sp. GEM-RC1]